MDRAARDKLAAKAERALAAAQKAGAGQAAVRVSRSRFVDVGYRNGGLDKAEASTKQGLSLRLYVDGRYAVHSTSDLRDEALDKFVAEAAALTRYLEPDPYRSLADAARYAKPPAPDLGMYDPRLAELPAEEWRDRAMRLEAVVRRHGSKLGPKLVSAQGGAYCETALGLFATSDGFLGSMEETGAFQGASLVFLDPDEPAKRRTGWWWEGGVSLEEVGGPEALDRIAQEAGRRARRSMGARPVQSGRVPVLVENQAAGRLIGDLLGVLKGPALHQKKSFLLDSLGQAVASPLVTIVDDPLFRGGLGSRWFDDEGVAAARLPVIRAGVLENYFLDTYYARTLKLAPTTGGTSNLLLEPSHRDGFDGLMAGLGSGLAVTGFLGGNFNPTTGDFSYGVNGLWIKGGKPAHAVEGVNLAGNFRELWNRLAAVGSDAYPYARLRSPSLVFSEVQLGGSSLAPGKS